MSKNKVTPLNIHSNEPKAARRSGVQDFGNLVPDDLKTGFGDRIGETLYIVKVEKKFSDNYGDGYVVSYKELPNAKDTFTTGVFGAVPGKQMDALYQATNDGSRISLTSPVAVKIEQVPTKKGMSYKFVSPSAK